MVVEDGRTGWVELESAAELLKRFVVHAVPAQGHAGDHVNVPVVCRGGEEVGNAVACGLLFTAREQHIDAIEVGLGGCGIELERLIEGATRMHHVDLSAEAVAHILQLGDAEAAPAGGILRVFGSDPREERVSTIEIEARAGAHHERTEHGASLKVVLADRAGKRGIARRGARSVHLFPGRQAVQGGKNFIGYLGLYGDEIERSNANGAAGANASGADIEQLPVEIEAFVGTKKAAREHIRDKQFLSNLQRVHLVDGELHERAGWPDDDAGNSRQARGDGIGEREAVERRSLSGAEVSERQHH